MNLTNYVKTFLLENGIVEISGLGVFQTQYTAPHFNEEKRVFSAPKKEISFSKQQTGNTDIVRFIAEKEYVSLKIAAKFWEAYSQVLVDKLQAEKRVELEGLGVLELQDNSEYLFLPSKNLALLDSAFGLEDIQEVQTFTPQPIHIEEQQEKIIELIEKIPSQVEESELPKEEVLIEDSIIPEVSFPVQEEKTIEQTAIANGKEDVEVEDNEEKASDVHIEIRNQVPAKKSKAKRRILRIILALIILCALYCCYLYYLKYEKNKVNSTPNTTTQIDTTASNTTPIMDTNTDTVSQTYDTKSPSIAQNEAAEMFDGIEFVQNSRKGIDIIAGFFKVKENAAKHAAQMKTQGFEPYVIKEEKNGKEQYYVSIGSFDKKNDATNFMRTSYKEKKIELVLKEFLRK